MRIYILVAYSLFFGYCEAQTDTSCLDSKPYLSCLLENEKKSIKQVVTAERKGDSLIIKTKIRKLLFKNIIFNEESPNWDSVKNYIFIKQIKGYVIIERIANYDGNTWLLVNLNSGQINSFDALPVFSPSMKRLMVVSGKLHNPYSPESVFVYKPGKKGWEQEYKTDAKALEAYGYGKWTSDNRIVLAKYDWAIQSKTGKPLRTETVLLYEFAEWRRVTKKEN